MHRDASGALYSAKDLLNFLSCVHCTALDLQHADGTLGAPDESEDAYLKLLKDKGIEHERQYLDQLRAEGRTILDIAPIESLEAQAEATRKAMREGVDIIYQGALVGRPWHGYSDFLHRIDTPSKLGDYSYEVSDTKLARSPRPKHVLQLCLYSQLVAREQGVMPENAHIQLGDGKRVTLRIKDFLYYCDAAQQRFLDFVSGDAPVTEAEPCQHCELCRWSGRCGEWWESTDHLSLVARMSRTQRQRLVAHGVSTLASLAELGDDVAVNRMHNETLKRLRSQARLQYVKRTTNENRVEALPLEPRRGFARLPLPDEGDLFFDMEGDPVYAMDGSLEYLFGFHFTENGKHAFKAIWALNREQEKQAFEDAVDFIVARLDKYPDAFVYHYASYEEVALKKLAQKYGSAPKALEENQTQALKRLAQEYGTRENEVDDLLRGRKLVDLYKVVREGVRVSERSYSLKNLEVFFGTERTQTITSGGDSVVAFEQWLTLGDDALLQQIEEYNKIDCESTRHCRDWLLTHRPANATWFDPRAEAHEDAEAERKRKDERREADTKILMLRGALVLGQPDSEQEWRVLLGYLLEYHRREARREWWEFFARRDEKTQEELIDDADCIGGLTIVRSIPPRTEKKSTIWTLAFPAQDTKLGPGSEVVRRDTGKTVTIVSLDESTCRLELKMGNRQQPPVDGMALIAPGPIHDGPQREAIERYAQAVIDGRQDDFRAITSILRRERPSVCDGPIVPEGVTDLLAATVSAIRRMHRTHLLIQGPPGSGKTYTAARAIVELLRDGRRIGVTALSHKAINNLLAKVEEVALAENVKFTGIKKNSDDDDALNGSIIEDTTDNDDVLSGSHQLVAGTAWLLSKPELEGRLDYLFVDEAGQLSLANVVASGMSAKNLVLIGDQMQLSQPIKGSHPGGSGVSVLDHLMNGQATVPADRGIFLDRTWRLHPELCAFVSEAFYDGRLRSVDNCVMHAIGGAFAEDDVIAPYGLRFVAVEHAENAQKSEQEGERLKATFVELLGRKWTNSDGVERPVTIEDILVVSPYNMQVNYLKEILPDGARVGTVDKFQGQEAAVVLISMASSSAEYIPRGIEFLFSPNRLNVAISRARCLSIVFASPQLLATACRSVGQLRQVNIMCWMRAISAPLDALRTPLATR